jgi:adenine deaminase
MPQSAHLSLTSRERIRSLAKVALGEAEADMAIVNGDVLNVYTGEVLAGDTVLIKGDRIAYVGRNAGRSIGPSTMVIDATGKVLIPGLIDGHSHADTTYLPSELARYALKGGTTTVITEMCGIVFPLGYRGIIQFLKAVAHQPLKFLATVPPMVTLSPAAEEHALTVAELRRLLRRRDIIGLGEPYWAQVVAGSQRVNDLIVETLNSGKSVDGHTSGASNAKLQAYIAAGISSCHEPITAEEVRERLRLGLFVLIREGEIRRELEAVAELNNLDLDLNRLAIATDGIGPWQLTADGYMEFVVQKAIDLGFEPVTAIKMATINPAQHFGLDGLIGGIAPGKYADIVVIPDLRTIRAEYVISNGQLVARDGELLVEPPRFSYPRWTHESVRFARDFTADDFAVPVSPGRGQVRVRVIEYVTSLVTREALVDFVVSGGRLRIDAAADLLKAAVIDRTHVPGKTFTGFIRGLKMERGAVASSAVWDMGGLVVAGASETDMAQAVNRVRQLRGGVVVCAGGGVLAEVALPVAGLVSEQPVEAVARELDAVQRAAADLGFPYPDARTTLAVLTTPAIPFLRMCEDGLFSINQNDFVSLIVD